MSDAAQPTTPDPAATRAGDVPDGASQGLAVVTGASSGIGLALAEELVDHGYDVVVAAEDAELHTAAARLRESGREVVPVQVDLTRAEGVEELWRQVLALGRPAAVGVLNAGVGVGGRFAETALERHLELVDLNVRSTVHLGKRLVDAMVAQGEGRILVTASIAAVMPGPYQATYNASKAFVHAFAEGIRHELADTGVTVTSLMPGPTDTEFFERADLEDTPLGQGPKDPAEDVAEDGFAALMSGKPQVVAGSFKNKLMARAGSHLPDRAAAAAMAKQTKPRDD